MPTKNKDEFMKMIRRAVAGAEESHLPYRTDKNIYTRVTEECIFSILTIDKNDPVLTFFEKEQFEESKNLIRLAVGKDHKQATLGYEKAMKLIHGHEWLKKQKKKERKRT